MCTAGVDPIYPVILESTSTRHRRVFLSIYSCKQLHTIAQRFQFFDAKDSAKFKWGRPQLGLQM